MEYENIGTKLEDRYKYGEERIKQDELFLRGGEILLNSGALQGLLLGLNEDSDIALEAKLDAIRVEVKIVMLDFFLLE